MCFKLNVVERDIIYIREIMNFRNDIFIKPVKLTKQEHQMGRWSHSGNNATNFKHLFSKLLTSSTFCSFQMFASRKCRIRH